MQKSVILQQHMQQGRNNVQALRMIGTEQVSTFWDLGLHEQK
jgi:hypothetical protein